MTRRPRGTRTQRSQSSRSRFNHATRCGVTAMAAFTDSACCSTILSPASVDPAYSRRRVGWVARTPLYRADVRSCIRVRLRRSERSYERPASGKDASVICRQLEPPLARPYGCALGRPLRVPRAPRRIEVPMRELFASVDPTVQSVIQISSQTTRQDGYSLILFYRRDANGKWRVHKVMIGGYG